MGAACCSQALNIDGKEDHGKHGNDTIAFVGAIGERTKSDITKQPKKKKKLKAPITHAPTHREQESITTQPSLPKSTTSKSTTEDVFNSTRSDVDAAFSPILPASNTLNPLQPPDVAELPIWIPVAAIATASECGVYEASSEFDRSAYSKDFGASVLRAEDHVDYPQSVDPFERRGFEGLES